MPPSSSPTRRLVAAYWITTGLLALNYAIGGVVDVLQPPAAAEVMKHLGYPPYFLPMLGVAKLLAVPALLVPGFPRLREWAYAGITFNLLAAAYSHFRSGDGAAQIAVPLAILALAAVSLHLSRRVRVG
jgi:hypothetical protein